MNASLGLACCSVRSSWPTIPSARVGRNKPGLSWGRLLVKKILYRDDSTLPHTPASALPLPRIRSSKKREKDGSSAPQEMWNQHQVPQIQQVHLKVHAKTIRSCSSNTNSHTWGNVTKLGSRFKKLDLDYFCVYHHNDWRGSMMGCIN